MEAISLTTERLIIDPLTPNQQMFIYELVNTEGWLTNIGNRNVNSADDASAYIDRILNNPSVKYWVVKLNTSKEPIGIITWIKRDYLPNNDIGFAFLPQYFGKGYAYEASSAVLNDLLTTYNDPYVFATTIPSNTTSIKLLEKLGFSFKEEMEVDKTLLKVYALKVN